MKKLIILSEEEYDSFQNLKEENEKLKSQLDSFCVFKILIKYERLPIYRPTPTEAYFAFGEKANQDIMNEITTLESRIRKLEDEKKRLLDRSLWQRMRNKEKN